MNFIKKSKRKNPAVSLVLLDWNVRESFHILHYLGQQTVPRDSFEIIIIEYYDSISEPLKQFEHQVDTWITLDMPQNCYYHKHLMYNVGIALANGDIVMIGDSDAMVRETFIETIIEAFERESKIVFHIDQFRNMRRDFYPFSYPSFEEVLGEGCANNVDGKTAGVLNTEDPIHSRNYGACMCARREDLIAIGGADEHIDYLGHICGPYDMTFRLNNIGRREVWDMNEFMSHTWHPGQAGTDNYLGPHDGQHMSTTALEAITSGRVLPLVENKAIGMLREKDADVPFDTLTAHLIDPAYETEFDTELVDSKYAYERFDNYEVPMGNYRGYRVTSILGRLTACPLVPPREGVAQPIESDTMDVLRARIDTRHGDAVVEPMRSAARSAVLRALGRLAIRRAREAARAYGRATKLTTQLIISPFVLPVAYMLNVGNFRGWFRSKLQYLMAADYVKLDQWLNLAACLSMMRGEGYLTNDDKVVVIIDCPDARRFLESLEGRGRFPKAEILLAPKAEDVKRTLESLSERQWNGSILVQGALYTQHHAVFMASPYAGRLSVI